MGTDFIIKELDDSIVKDLHTIDEEFVIDARLELKYENHQLTYEPVPVAPRTKRYPPDDYNYTAYINNPDKTAFLAYSGNRVAGQLILHRHWNAFAWVEGIGVDKDFRRQGVGRMLVIRGSSWARNGGMVGIMAESQDNNVKAAGFYKATGFVLGGFDTHLYQASDSCREEVALFWYLVL